MRLTDYRKRENMTMLDLALKLGVTETTVSRYEAGHRRPEWPILERIVEITGGDVQANDFFGISSTAAE